MPGNSTTGGGSLPGETLPTTQLAVDVDAPNDLAAALRRTDPPVIAKITEGSLTLDPRTVLPEQDEQLVTNLRAALARLRERVDSKRNDL